MAASSVTQAQTSTQMSTQISALFDRSNQRSILWMIAFACLTFALLFGNVARAQGSKVGFVNTERILRDSAPAKAAQTKIEAEFKKREEEIQRLGNNLRTAALFVATAVEVLLELTALTLKISIDVCKLALTLVPIGSQRRVRHNY